ncbi:MAG TPA: SH3 domain-containing protein [Vicinamibacterales bacterium]|nr:SH3 domain-containing protein [Vicinamibacterales bacterium]
MIRQAAAVVVVLLLSPSWVTAQSPELTINVASANVHKGPSNTSPVLGVVGRGAKLEVTREVGDWVKIAFPPAPDGVGYVRVSLGAVSNGVASATSKTPVQNTAAPARASAQPTPTPRVVTAQVIEPAQTGNQLPVRNTAPSGPSHVFGLGARLGGPALGLGASARGWSRGRLGIQLEVARYEMSNPVDLGTVSSTEFGPSVLYAFNDHVADYTWLRPYLGAGMNFYRSSTTTSLVGVDTSDSGFGAQMFGGGELSFASLPQFAISTELSYRWFDAPFEGLDLGGVGFSVAGHWYIK